MNRLLLKIITGAIVLLLVNEESFGMSRGPALAKKQGLIGKDRLSWEEEKSALEKEEAEIEKNYKEKFFALGSENTENFFEKQGRALEELEEKKDAAEINYKNKRNASWQKKFAQKERIAHNQLYNDALNAIYNYSNERTLSSILLKMKEKCSGREFTNYIFELSKVADEYSNQTASDVLQQMLIE
jgi:hypothetical protein